jgi:hypothetical protein
VAQTFELQVTGAVQASPFASLSGGQSLQDFLTFNVRKAYNGRSADVSSIAATDGSPYTLPLGTIAKVRFLGIHVLAGALKALLTNPSETDQVVRFGDWLFLHCPNPGEELTAIKLVGTADFEYFVAGDPS